MSKTIITANATATAAAATSMISDPADTESSFFDDMGCGGIGADAARGLMAGAGDAFGRLNEALGAGSAFGRLNEALGAEDAFGRSIETLGAGASAGLAVEIGWALGRVGVCSITAFGG